MEADQKYKNPGFSSPPEGENLTGRPVENFTGARKERVVDLDNEVVLLVEWDGCFARNKLHVEFPGGDAVC